MEQTAFSPVPSDGAGAPMNSDESRAGHERVASRLRALPEMAGGEGTFGQRLPPGLSSFVKLANDGLAQSNLPLPAALGRGL
jgi:hypothetical protein